MPTGKIVEVSYWYTGLSAWTVLWYEGMPGVPTPPTVPLNTDFQLAAWWVNRGTTRAKGRVDFIVTKPDGSKVTLVAVANQDKEADPNYGFGVTLAALKLDESGSYSGDVALKMEDAVPGVTGSFFLGLSWYPIGTSHWMAYWWDGAQWIPNDGGWQLPSTYVKFSNIPLDGWLSVGLYNQTTGVLTVYPPAEPWAWPFTVVNGGIYSINPGTGVLSKIG